MQELVIKNMKTTEYETFNLNQFYAPNDAHRQSFEFQRGNVVSPSPYY